MTARSRIEQPPVNAGNAKHPSAARLDAGSEGGILADEAGIGFSEPKSGLWLESIISREG